MTPSWRRPARCWCERFSGHVVRVGSRHTGQRVQRWRAYSDQGAPSLTTAAPFAERTGSRRTYGAAPQLLHFGMLRILGWGWLRGEQAVVPWIIGVDR